ncbi:putative cortical actin cytoskeleton protein vip1 [Golovinomyces cichoracearum]|uniref:Putative cortical actin cytoskeleton protein vip1 n=1 Tax=Golovinomyces cichoracearum TaxID=62708 RepID=A0A420IA66_9PEZI|nr:putative cortical actin cytoskeleton protein vip1 [Golovinomyces cichoracearum]
MSQSQSGDVQEEILGVLRRGAEYTIISQKSGDKWNLRFLKVSKLSLSLRHHLFDLPLHLQGEVNVIISIVSGICEASKYYTQVISPLLNTLGVTHKPLYTTSCTSIKEFAQSLTGTVILLSGDGGVNDLVNYAKSGLIIVLIPMGSGNAIYNSYIKNELYTMLRGSPIPLPNFEVSFSQAILDGKQLESMLGAVIVSYGFHPTLVDESEKYREYGAKRFEMVAEELLKKPRKYTGTVNGEEMKGYAAATMVKKLDSDFEVSAENELRLIHTDTSDLMKGYHGGLGAWRVDRVEFQARGKICVDGLIVELMGQAVVEEVPSRMKLVI